MKCEIFVVYVVCKCKASKIELHQSTAASMWWCGPRPVWVGSKRLLAFPRVPVTPGTPLTQTIFSPCSPLNDCRRVARSFLKIGLSSLYSCLSLAHLLILLLLLMSGNVHLYPCPVFPPTPGAAFPAFFEILHLPALCLSPRTSPCGIPSLLNLAFFC